MNGGKAQQEQLTHPAPILPRWGWGEVLRDAWGMLGSCYSLWLHPGGRSLVAADSGGARRKEEGTFLGISFVWKLAAWT